MKPIRILMICLTVLLTPVLLSCDREEPSVDFSVASLTLKAAGGSETVSLTTNYPWTATASDPWIQVSPTSGKKGTTSLSIRVDANDKSTTRKGSVTINCHDLTRAVTITQQPDLPQQLIIKHGNASFAAPVFTGSSVTGTVKWGDGAEDTWRKGLTHTYSSAGTYMVETFTAGAISFKVESLSNVAEIDFLKF